MILATRMPSNDMADKADKSGKVEKVEKVDKVEKMEIVGADEDVSAWTKAAPIFARYFRLCMRLHSVVLSELISMQQAEQRVFRPVS